MPLDPHDREILAGLRRQFTACTSDIGKPGCTVDSVADAIATHLAAMTTANMPPSAQPIWLERVARPLKVDAAKPLPPRSISAIRSWPAARVSELVAALVAIEAVLVDVENEALHEAIYVEISRAYS